MKKNLLYISCALFLSAALASCGPDEAKTDGKDSLKPLVDESTRPQYKKAVDDAEAAFRNKGGAFDPALANAAIKAYNDYANFFPKDTLAPEYLFRASDLAQGTRNYKQSTIFLERIIEMYPNYQRHPEACFIAAFTYDSYLERQGGETRAKELYEFIIKRYPNTRFAADSKALLEYLGVPDSVMLDKIIKKGQESK